MSISDEYFRYLAHFGSVVTIRDMAARPELADVIALRHDVDHDLDIALEMGYWEHRRGVTASYYLLDTAPYWENPDFIAKCKQLAAFGHEIGLHLNSLSKWIKGQTLDVLLDLRNSLDRLRREGIIVDSVSAHGDRLCYERQFINYWCFQDLRPADPAARENGLSAEGIAVSDSRFQIGYPASHALKREDGAEFPLWSIPMSSVKLRYEAMHISFDCYFTDSGGSWTRTPDPIAQDLTHGRNQILIHPEYWRGLQKLYFFLSTPRSGSKWLSEFLDRATPLRGTHEFTLNHRFQDGQLRADKLTLEHTNDLTANPALVRDLMLESRAWIEESPRDYAEANVYLGHFIGTLDQVFPDATLVHLHRDPKDVIRSLINRDWYDTPEDDRHPSVPVDGWSQMSQFEKACWYVRAVNESLIARCPKRIRFEEMVADSSTFTADLEALGISVYPLLAAPLFGRPLNLSYHTEFPDYEHWGAEIKAIYHAICGGLRRDLGYASNTAAIGNADVHATASSDSGVLARWRRRDLGERKVKLFQIDFSRLDWLTFLRGFGLFAARQLNRLRGRRGQKTDGMKVPESWVARVWANGLRAGFRTQGCEIAFIRPALRIRTRPRTHCSIVIGGGTWHRISPQEGWKANIGHRYHGTVVLEVKGPSVVTLFCLMYEGSELREKRSVVRISANNSTRHFSFKTRPMADRFTLALYAGARDESCEFAIHRIVLEEIEPRAR
ncbi:MAG: sulfotransferase [Gammaproteobacteria bacterium]